MEINNKDPKILQIIPAQPGLWANWSMRTSPDHVEHALVVAFALVENDCGGGEIHQSLRPMCMIKNGGGACFLRSSESIIFHGCTFMDAPEEWKSDTKNKDPQISQLIPAPSNLWAKLHPCDDSDYTELAPVMAVALVDTQTPKGDIFRSMQTVHLQQNAGLVLTNSRASDACHGYIFTDKPDSKWNGDDE